MDINDDLEPTKEEPLVDIGVFTFPPNTNLTMPKKLLESLLYSHFCNMPVWFEWTEIEEIELKEDQITFTYKEKS